jgi:hypothetical protein
VASPLRFIGTGETCEIDGVTIPARCAVEVTFRTHQQEYLLRPDDGVNEILLGCFGRALARYPSVNPCVLNALSNHGSFLALPDSVHEFSSFMRDFLSTAAVRLNGHRARSGTFWERRYRLIPVIDEQALENRFRYILTQGTKENLLWSARDWPGVTSIDALLGGAPLVGRWRDGSTETELRKQRRRKLQRASARGKRLELPPVPEVWIDYPIELTPLPHWARLSSEERQRRVAAILDDDDVLTRERHARCGTRPLGVAGVLATSPFDRPDCPAKSPAPACHASTEAGRRAFRKLSKLYAASHREARELLQQRLEEMPIRVEVTLPPLRHFGRTVCVEPARASPTSEVGRREPVAHDAKQAPRVACGDPESPPDPRLRDMGRPNPKPG